MLGAYFFKRTNDMAKPYLVLIFDASLVRF